MQEAPDAEMVSSVHGSQSVWLVLASDQAGHGVHESSEI